MKEYIKMKLLVLTSSTVTVTNVMNLKTISNAQILTCSIATISTK